MSKSSTRVHTPQTTCRNEFLAAQYTIGAFRELAEIIEVDIDAFGRELNVIADPRETHARENRRARHITSLALNDGAG